MRRLMDKSQWMPEGRARSNLIRGAKLFGVLILAACAGANSRPPNGALDDAPDKHSSGPAYLVEETLIHPVALADLRAHKTPIEAGVTTETNGTIGHADGLLHKEFASALTCMALNIYWEARNQSMAGQLAVAQVTMNRVLDPRYGNEVCDVVYEHYQFSWYWDGKSDRPRDNKAWQTALLVASAAMDGSGHVELQGVTHYHAVYIQPYWKDYMVQVTMIGDHVFYTD